MNKCFQNGQAFPPPKEALQQILDKSLADTPDLLTFIKRLEEAKSRLDG